MQESVVESKKALLNVKSKGLGSTTPMQKLLLTSQAVSTLNEKELKPYWNTHCLELQSNLWLPTEIGSPDLDLKSSKKSSNHQEEILNSWMKRLTPKKLASTQPSLLPSSHLSVTATTENDQLKFVGPIRQKISQKVRIFPANKEKYYEMICTYRRAYNLAVEFFLNFYQHKGLDENGEKIDLRNKIRKIVSEECLKTNKAYNSNVVNEAVKEANQKFIEVCRKNKKRKDDVFSELGFKSCKKKIQTWRIDRLPKSHMPCKNEIGGIYITERISNCSEGQSISVTLDHGRWYMNVVKYISLIAEKQGEVRCVSVDPGSRKFATCYSEDEVLIAGDGFVVNYLVPLTKEMRKLDREKRKLNSIQFDMDVKPQWYYDRIKCIENKIDKITQRKSDLVLDLHQKTAFYLVSHYDVIFLPTFETKKMVKKGKRKINKTSVTNLLSLNHYQFKQLIKWYAKKYGKHLIDVNESYTSKTMSWNGFIDENLGSKKHIMANLAGQKVKICRDINGARGIFIKSLSLLGKE